MQFDAIFFDNDGVLCDTERTFFHACRDVLAEEGVKFSVADFQKYVLENRWGARQFLIERGWGKSATAECHTRWTERYAQLLRTDFSLIPGALEILKKVHGKFWLGLVTGARKWDTDIKLDRTGIGRFFDTVVTRDDVAEGKPDPAGYQLALERSGISPEKCLVIEDSPRGIEAARSAGITCWAVRTDLAPAMDLRGADRILKNISELSAVLEII